MSGIAPARTTRGSGAGRASRFPAVLLGLLAGCLLIAPAASARTGLGDPFYPALGNPGYDVARYDAHLSYQPSTGQLQMTESIGATATEAIANVALDLDGLHVSSATVNGAEAQVTRGADKLIVNPAAPLAAGETFTVALRYHGRPEEVGSEAGIVEEGWLRTADGAVGLGEPTGTSAWLACNNALGDKASFGLQVTVPKGLKAAANGRLLSVARRRGRTTFEWNETEPMAPYLATVDIGRGQLVHSTISGLPAWTLVDPGLAGGSRRAIAALPEIVRFESRSFGPYPFDALGSIVDFVPQIDYALETETRPTYAFPPDRQTVAHEMAHQWFGDSVGLTRWPEIWLNEGFATWAEWFYAERHGGPSAAKIFQRLYRTPASDKGFWEPPSGHPGAPRHLFGTSVYQRGGLTLEALRMKIGTGALLTVLRDWAERHRYGNATIPEFIALADEVSGRDLQGFFNAWLYKPGKPRGYA